MLAIVLALALFWYAVNPAPGPILRAKKTEGPPDEERRDAETTVPAGYGLELMESKVTPPYALPLSTSEGDDADALEWPEVIDF